jgi:enoyl-CoA hydratase/carnithine racemase
MEKEGGVAVITLCNPPANTYSYELNRRLDEAILDARFDDDVHVLVLRGAGERFFCAGADIAMLDRVTPQFKYQFCLHANETLLRLDIGLPEVTLGVLPGTGGTQRFARLVGASRAIDLMTSGRNFDVDEALRLGVVNRIVDADSVDGFMAAVMETARGYCPPHRASKAVGLIKRAVRSGSEVPLESGLALERELQQQLFQSEDAREGIGAYNEKRRPAFRGR